ncbi:MAG: hypothetical protein HY023_00650 [Chloroflexi bacterium]|nr:hypothetical protein [Chloroflexota bacterium]MBI3764715.1 hypothetical protein [Chloroflexota bacterium]
MVYKISYVVQSGDHPGAIVNAVTPPQIGDRVQLGSEEFEVVEVFDLMPARGEFHFLHATCKRLSQDKRDGK